MLTDEDQKIIRQLIREGVREATPAIAEAVVAKLQQGPVYDAPREYQNLMDRLEETNALLRRIVAPVITQETRELAADPEKRKAESKRVAAECRRLLRKKRE